MNLFSRIVLGVSLSLALLSAADLNSTIVDGNATRVYQTMLSKLKNEQNLSQPERLEMSLLSLLTDDKAQKKLATDTKIRTPKNGQEASELFDRYLDTVVSLRIAREALDKTQEKIATIEREISLLEHNSSKLIPLELQDALYHKNIRIFQEQLKQKEQKVKQMESMLTLVPQKTLIDTVALAQEINATQQALAKIDSQIDILTVNKEQANLIGDTHKVSLFDAGIMKLQAERQKLIRRILGVDFLHFSSKLHSKNSEALSIGKRLIRDTQGLKVLTSEDRDHLTLLLHAMEDRYLGTLTTLTQSGKEEVKTLWYQVWGFISKPIFSIHDTPVSILKILLSLTLLILGFIAGALYKRKIKNLPLNARSFTTTTRTLLANMGYYTIIMIASLMALNALGITLSSLALVAGALSVGIGFGLQNIVSNFVSGLILMFERSVKIGDYVQLDDNLRGYVSDIRMRSTTIKTNENIDVVVPNQKLIENNVINWTMNDHIRRFSIPFGVAYGTDVHRVIDVVIQAIAQSPLQGDIVESGEHHTRVIMTAMADSSVNMELLVWVQGDFLNRPKRSASEFLILIYDTLYAHNIEIPFPQQDIHIRSVEGTFPVITKTASPSPKDTDEPA